MKLLMIANCIYLPIGWGNKYIAASISGTILSNMENNILTREEIMEKHKDSTYPVTEHDHLHDLCKAWGTKH